MRILISGGCGFIGANLIASLSNADDLSIRVIDNESLGKHEHISEFGVELIKGDITDPDAFDQAMKGVDAVVHLAADTRVEDSLADPAHNFQVNVVGTFNLLQSMRAQGVKRVVFASSGGTILGEAQCPVHENMLPKPISPYGASKLAGEGYLSAFAGAYGIKACSLRFSNVYGPRSFHKGSVVAKFFKEILVGKKLTVFGDGAQTRDYIYAADLCQGIIKALSSQQIGVFQLGTGRPTTINQLLDQIREIVPSRYPVEVEYTDFRSGEIINNWCDISKAKEILGFDPKTSLQDGLRATWQWFLEHKSHFEIA